MVDRSGAAKLVLFALVALVSASLAMPAAVSTAGSQEGDSGWFLPPYQYEQPGEDLGISLYFHGHVMVAAGSCQRPAENIIRCTVPEEVSCTITLTADVSPTGPLRVTAVALPPGATFTPVTGYGTATTRCTFTPPEGSAGQTYELFFRATTVYELSADLKVIIDVVAAPTPTPPPVVGPPVVPPPAEIPRIEVVPASLDFGGVAVGSSAKLSFQIGNQGNAPLWVTYVGIEGGDKSPFSFPWAVFTAFHIAPGGSTSFDVLFSPKTAADFKDTIIIISNDPTQPRFNLPLQGKAAKKKSSISCSLTVRARPGGVFSIHKGGRETEVLVTVTLSPARAANYTVKITEPGGKSHGPLSYKTDTSGKDKRVITVWVWGQGTGNITGKWKAEVSWKGDKEYEGASGQCQFTAGKLGSYHGSTVSTTEPNRVNISYRGFCADNCTKIVLIQVFSDRVVFTDNTSEWIKPSETGATFTFLDADAVEVAGRWFTVDYLRGENDPYYNGDDTADGGVQGRHDTAKTAATITDAPRYSDTIFDELKKKYNKEVDKIVTEFETFAFCAAGRDRGKYYQGIKWKYEKKKGELGESTIVERTLRPSEGFKEAVKKWCTNHGFTLPGP